MRSIYNIERERVKVKAPLEIGLEESKRGVVDK